MVFLVIDEKFCCVEQAQCEEKKDVLDLCNYQDYVCFGGSGLSG